MSSNPPSLGAPTAPGPPISTALKGSKSTSNPFGVDLVIPFSTSVGKDRIKDSNEIKESYEYFLRALESEGGLRIASRSGNKIKGKEEIWVFVGASDEKISELLEREQSLDKNHNLPQHNHEGELNPATRLRLIYNLLTAPTVQHGLGITPGEGKWKRVKSIMALHDEEMDRVWIERWTKGDWKVGLIAGLDQSDSTNLGAHQPPPIHLYFEFLTTYSLSLLPLSIISVLFYLLTPADSYPPLYAFLLCLYSTTFVSLWRIKERKLAVRWGTSGCESVAVGRLRPEYVANMGWDKAVPSSGENTVEVIQAGHDLTRDAKVALSVPVILICGMGLGVVLMGIFVLEAFVGQVYDGMGKQIVPLMPTALFVLVVPQIVGAYGKLANRLVKWEDHPTPVGAEKSLTGKTFAMNGIVAYLGLFLSAFVYVPFGPFIMNYVQGRMTHTSTPVASTPEQAGLGPRTSGEKQHAIKADRLKGQLFAYTVTNQVVNIFLELGLPYLLRFVADWRSGKTTLKATLKKRDGEEASPTSESEVEERFLKKVERELALPDYSLFTDYAEMVTQFGYVTIWSIVWPLAPVFALLNNYIELRSDALKICKHVRRPIGDRVETIGSWLQTLSIISWIGAVTNATLIYLFRPSTALHHQTPNPNVPIHGNTHISVLLATYRSPPTLQTLLPVLIPLGLIALAASHGFLVLRWVVDGIAERVLWRGSEEERKLQKLKAKSGNVEQRVMEKRIYDLGSLRGGFWNGGEEGAREIGRVTKAE
ncbi:hypothetical protein TREMEDRAFT_26589 [Tremella mesenterica DSM 1558]|uniref:uncharacterized protein n=1 Tax=Tremella mesenterica (strain ATCC 24925 / CBS 8224 / DSM 1558 / NBRC 9311 / NRRL Y-6157 / RJB 2259-6 / UBC 559-6) TaxID=578456 RepID=UPI0003F49D62|nr:uncharacterized protein TREMEDRAFT_26589 [Tremella mesenterica DSM 1558]EIW72964.1 hypothetical protein TREMEDRAFT_26589 [Tremella mesenterica DSM 1558]